MIALDTNILVRYLVEDDPVQARAARQLIEELTYEEPGFVSLVVLCELSWSLHHTYRHSHERIAATIGAFLETRQLEIEAPDIVARALDTASPDIPDALIHEIGKASGCSRTLTFDRKFARIEGVELLDS